MCWEEIYRMFSARLFHVSVSVSFLASVSVFVSLPLLPLSQKEQRVPVSYNKLPSVRVLQNPEGWEDGCGLNILF